MRIHEIEQDDDYDMMKRARQQLEWERRNQEYFDEDEEISIPRYLKKLREQPPPPPFHFTLEGLKND